MKKRDLQQARERLDPTLLIPALSCRCGPGELGGSLGCSQQPATAIRAWLKWRIKLHDSIGMTRTAAIIRFEAKLLRPAERPKGASWSFVVLPKDASARLPTRGMTAVEGTINGHPFRATLEPDGQKSHWLKVNKKMREAAGAEEGDVVPLEISSVARQPEPRVPVDLRKALADSPAARAVWSDITPVARRDWIHWITSAKQPETRARRIRNACEMLAAGKRRVCCFDRSGLYGGSPAAPKVVEADST